MMTTEKPKIVHLEEVEKIADELVDVCDLSHALVRFLKKTCETLNDDSWEDKLIAIAAAERLHDSVGRTLSSLNRLTQSSL